MALRDDGHYRSAVGEGLPGTTTGLLPVCPLTCSPARRLTLRRAREVLPFPAVLPNGTIRRGHYGFHHARLHRGRQIPVMRGHQRAESVAATTRCAAIHRAQGQPTLAAELVAAAQVTGSYRRRLAGSCRSRFAAQAMKGEYRCRWPANPAITRSSAGRLRRRCTSRRPAATCRGPASCWCCARLLLLGISWGIAAHRAGWRKR